MKEIDETAVHFLRNLDCDRFSDDPSGLHTGGHGGHQAMNIAYLSGAKRIVLLGYDMQFGKANKAHWFGDHPVKTTTAFLNVAIKTARTVIPQLRKAGIDVINCSPASRLDCFRKADIGEVFQ